MRIATVDYKIKECDKCPHALVWRTGNPGVSFRWTCLLTLRDVKSFEIDEGCPLVEEGKK